MQLFFNAGAYDVVVVGAGHAGCEAALAAARLQKKTLLVTLSLDAIANMPCNPAIGGTGKSQLVKEIDALGGEMGVCADRCMIQSRTLNASKGPAVQSLRVQEDKQLYHRTMKATLENTENLDIIMDEVTEIIVTGDSVKGIRTKLNCEYETKTVILSTGVYLNGKVFIGEVNFSSGPLGQLPATFLTDSLMSMGLPLRRFKTGTPARVHKDSIDFEKMVIQPGDEIIEPFSFLNDDYDKKNQIDCYLTRTTKRTHEIILNNIGRSAMYGGYIHGQGPRYCPSIEDKVIRFKDKESHQFFVEPEGLDTKEYYIQGFSTSLAYEVQLEMYRTVIGLEHCRMMRPAYAIEYDCIDPLRLKPSLEIIGINGLFSAGQFNGTSGYEEAAAQGLIAGINAVMLIDNKDPLILDRATAYIGVLIDDLVTKGTNEPYRMMTSRAEYRLLLRQDNADLRLTEIGYEIGLVDKIRYEKFKKRKTMIDDEIYRIKHEKVRPDEINPILETQNFDKLNNTMSIYDALKRPGVNYKNLKAVGKTVDLPKDVEKEAEITAKYEGYIKKQTAEVDSFRKLEKRMIPQDIDYKSISGLRLEAVQKLNDIKPLNIGQASRISGVSPADITVLLIYLKRLKK